MVIYIVLTFMMIRQSAAKTVVQAAEAANPM